MSYRELSELAQSIPCSTCKAEATKHCVTKAGKWTHMHTARTKPMYEAYGMGYNDCDRWHEDAQKRADARTAWSSS